MIKLSVIIPTCDRAGLLSKCLDSLLEQSFPADDFEVIVADNGSQDDTAKVCDAYRPRFARFKYLCDARPGLHVARHIGLKNASADILAYTDDDARAFPTWISGIVEAFEDPGVALAGGACLPEFDCPPPEWMESLWRKNRYGKYIGHYSLIDFGNGPLEISPQFVWGCNFSIRKSALLEAGGFHPDSMPAEMIKFRGDGETAVSNFLCEKKRRAVYNPAASVYHLVGSKRMTPEYLYERNFAQGVSQSFADIRKNKGTAVVSLKKYLSGLKRRIAELLDLNKISGGSGIPYEIENAIEKGFRDGYEYHLRETAADRNLLDWVLKEDYF